MAGLVLAVVVIVLVALCWARVRGRRPEPLPATHADDGGLAEEDVADIDATFALVDAAESAARDHRLACSLRPLVARRVPARVVEAVPALHAARIRFADGTCVLVRGTVPGNVALLASWARRRSLVASSCSTGADGTRLVFGSPHARRTVAVVVTGLDQPD